jgi:DUF4097 and DUF4098 domain-containing protein YvlB
MKRIIFGLLVLALTCGVASAQIQIDKRRPAPATGEIYVDNSFGSVRVTGGDGGEIVVVGTLAAGAEGLEFDSDEEGAWVQVDVPDSWFYDSDDDTDYQSHLEVQVPRGSSVYVETVNASIAVSGVDGTVQIETVNGPMDVTGNPETVEVETMTGSVEVSAEAAEMHVESISGPVTLRGAASCLRVKTVSGTIDVSGHHLEDVELETTAGDVRLAASFTEEGDAEVETFSGNVELILGAEAKARFNLITFSGQIDSEIGPRPTRDGRFNPYQELTFSTGLNDFDVSVETYSGSIVVRRDGAS